MSKVIITTDSTSDLSDELLEKYNIKKIPLYVNFNEKSYKDGIDITTEQLYKKVSELRYLPKTSAVSPGDFVDFFKNLLDEGYSIIHIGIGSDLSTTFNSAKLAIEILETNKILLVDSKNLSSGIGLLVLKGVKLIEENYEFNQIHQILIQTVPKVRSQFAIRTFDYLYKGGRCNALAKILGSILKIRPIIKVIDGKLDVYKKPMGKMTRSLDIMLNDFFIELNLQNVDLTNIMLTHSIAHKSLEYMKNKILEKLPTANIIISNAGCVISSHCGEGTIGILYILK